MRAAAVLAGCAAGLVVAGRRLRVRVEPDGRRVDGEVTGLSVPLPGYAGALVWVERVAAEPGRAEFDRVLVDRLATTAGIVLDRIGTRFPAGDSAAVELLVDATADEAARLAAARRLGLAPEGSFAVTVRAGGPHPPGAARLGDLAVTIEPRAGSGSDRFAVAATRAGAVSTAESGRGAPGLERGAPARTPAGRAETETVRGVRAAAEPATGGASRAEKPVSGVADLASAVGRPTTRPVAGDAAARSVSGVGNPASGGGHPAVRSASGPAVAVRDLPFSYGQAVLALRLTAVDEPGPSHVDAAEVGGLLALADGGDSPAATAEVTHLERVLAAHPWALATLTAVAAEPSLRAAAAVLHVHHSMLQSRVDLLAQELGYGLATPAGRTRLGGAGAAPVPPHPLTAAWRGTAAV